MSFAEKDPRISAILWAGYPGQAGGAAMADLLFGTLNPGAYIFSSHPLICDFFYKGF